MLRYIFFILVLLFGGVLLGWWIAEDAGYVLIAYRGLAWESSLWTGLLLFGAILLILALIYKLMFGFFYLPGNLGDWWQTRKKDRMENKHNKALLHLAAGDAEGALTTIDTKRKDIRTAVIAFEASLRSKNYQQAERRIAEIKKIGGRFLNQRDRSLFDLMEARVYTELEQYRRAFTLLENHMRYPLKLGNSVYKLARQICIRGEMWDEFGRLLPVTGPESLVQEYLLYFKRAKDLQALRAKWGKLDKKLRGALLIPYARRLVGSGYDDDAENLVRAQLQKRPDDDLIRVYGDMRSSQSIKQLHTLEELMRQLPQRQVSAAMLFALAELCLHNRMWAQANRYYERLIKEHPPALEQVAKGLKQVLRRGEEKDKRKARLLMNQAIGV